LSEFNRKSKCSETPIAYQRGYTQPVISKTPMSLLKKKTIRNHGMTTDGSPEHLNNKKQR
jgi:hypothetical protein